MPRIWRRLRRIRRSNVVVTALLIAVLAVMFGVNFDSQADVFEPPEAIDRSQNTPIVIPPGEPIVIGFSGPLTGPASERGTVRANAAISGVLRWKELNGDLIHGHRVDLVGEDDGGVEEDVAVVAANLLLARPYLVAIVGPVFSATTAATIDIYSAAGVIMISGSATRTDLTLTQSEPGFFFRTAFTNAVEGPRQAEILIERLPTGSAFVVDDREAYGMDLAESAVARLRDAGWSVVRGSFPPDTVDFSDLIARIDDAGADAVIFEGFNPEGALLLRQLRDTGYTGTFMAGDGVVSQAGFLDVLGTRAEGAILTGCPDTRTSDFLRLWEAGGGGVAPPISFLGSTADAAFILIDAVARVAEPQPDGSLLIDPLKLRDAIAATQTVGWASGHPIAFDQHGDRVGTGADAGLVSCEVRDGAFVEIAS